MGHSQSSQQNSVPIQSRGIHNEKEQGRWLAYDVAASAVRMGLLLEGNAAFASAVRCVLHAGGGARPMDRHPGLNLLKCCSGQAGAATRTLLASLRRYRVLLVPNLSASCTLRWFAARFYPELEADT